MRDDKWWFRLLKILYFGFYIFGFLFVGVVAYGDYSVGQKYKKTYEEKISIFMRYDTTSILVNQMRSQGIIPSGIQTYKELSDKNLKEAFNTYVFGSLIVAFILESVKYTLLYIIFGKQKI